MTKERRERLDVIKHKLRAVAHGVSRAERREFYAARRMGTEALNKAAWDGVILRPTLQAQEAMRILSAKERKATLD